MINNLDIKNFDVYLGNKQILHNINLHLPGGKIHVLMGPNGSGKSTLTMALAGHPNYKIKNQKSKIKINEDNIINLSPDERAKKGLFVTFQQPVAIPGVNVVNLLRLATFNNQANCPTGKWLKPNNNHESFSQFHKRLKSQAEKLALPLNFLSRSLNDDLSGGEKKKTETFQVAMLNPKYAIFDEIDTGLDVDALKIVAQNITELVKKGTGVLIITHYQRILKYLNPTKIYVLISGKIVKTGDVHLIKEIDEKGYNNI